MRICAAIIAVVLVVMSPLTSAQSDYPSKRIELLVGNAAGGSTDVLARLLAEQVRKSLGQEVIVVNQPGAGGTLALSAIAAATPDGYKLALTPSAAIVVAPFTQGVPDLFERTSPIIAVGQLRNGLVVRSDSPYRSIKELIGFARSNPGKVSVGVPSEGSVGALIMRSIAFQEKAEVSIVAFQGDAPSIVALLGGHITAANGTAAVWARQVDAGSLRLIATMEEDRFASQPKVATLKEQGGYPTTSTIFYILGPNGIPPVVTGRLAEAFAGAMLSPTYIDMVSKNEMKIQKPLVGAEIGRFLSQERAKVRALATKLGLPKK